MKHLGRTLVGYMAQEEAIQVMVGRAVQEDEQPALEHEWRRIQENVAHRTEYSAISPVIEPPPAMASRLEEFASRPDVQAALRGYEWSIGFADVSKGVLAYARVIDTDRAAALVPRASDEPEVLMDLCLPAPRQMVLEGAIDTTQMAFTVTSMDPNLRVVGFEVARVQSGDTEESRQIVGFRLNSGPSFVQLAEYNGRWLVRDGYHRLYELLRRGIKRVPCVLVKARTLEETGAGRPGFFGYETLFGTQPPLVTDFLDESLSARTEMRVSMRVIRIRAEEFAAPIPEEAGSI